ISASRFGRPSAKIFGSRIVYRPRSSGRSTYRSPRNCRIMTALPLKHSLSGNLASLTRFASVRSQDSEKFRHRVTSINPAKLLLYENEGGANPTFTLIPITPTFHISANRFDSGKGRFDQIGRP